MATSKSDAVVGVKDVTIGEVASVLQSGFFLVTGSSSADGYPIIFSLDGIYPEPEEEKQRSALIYLASLPTFSTDKNLHYCFVLDRRKSSWTCVRKLFTLISTSFCRPVKEVILLQPTGFFQKRFSTSESTKLQAEFPSLQTVVLDDTDSLVQKFGTENVCEELGGSIHANLNAFIQQRTSIDSLEVNCIDLEERVKELLLDDAQSDFDIPNDVASTEALLNEHAEIKKNLSDEIKNIKSQGEVVLQCFRGELEDLLSTQQMLHIQEVQKLTTRLDDLHEAIRDYWEKEEHKLQEFMKLREFHEEFKSLQHNLNKLSEALTNVKDFVSTCDDANNNTKRLSKIEIESESLLARAKWVSKVWSSKMSSTDGITIDTIGPKCEELTRLYNLCTGSLKHKKTLSGLQSTLHTHLDEAQQWLADGSSQPLDEEVKSEEVSVLSEQLKQIDCQIAIGKFLELLKFKDFMTSYATALTEESRVKVKDLYTEVMELMARYELGRTNLYDVIARLSAPLKNPKMLKKRKSSFMLFNKERSPTPSEDKTSPEIIDKSESIKFNEYTDKGGKVRHSSSNRGKTESQSSANSESSVFSSSASDERTTPGLSPNSAFVPVSPTSSAFSRGESSTRGDDSKGREDELYSEGSELASECSDQFSEVTRRVAELTTEPAPDVKAIKNSGRRGSIKAIKGMFTRKKSRAALLDDKSDLSLNVNSGVFEKSLTHEEEKTMAKNRSELISNLVLSEEKYVADLRHIIEFYMKPIAAAGDSVPTDLYANQSLIFSNLEEIYDFSSKIFLHELRDSIDSPSLIGAAFKNRANALSKYKDYSNGRSRAEVLLRQLAGDSFLAERVRLQGHNTSLCSQLLLPAKQIVYYNTFLQGMYNNLRDDLEAQRDIALVISLLSDTIQTADNLLHQVTIDGYHGFINYLQEVDLPTHGSLLHQGRVLVAHDKKSQNSKASEFKAKLKPRHVFLYEKCLLFCRIHEDNDMLRPYSYMHAIKLSDSTLEKSSETSNKFVFRCNNESYLIQCEVADQSSWYENIHFALNNCDSRVEELSPLRIDNSYTNTSMNRKQRSFIPDEDDIMLGEDPDVDMFDEGGMDMIDSPPKGKRRHSSADSHKEINGNSLKQYMLRDDFDNDLLLGRGDVVECVTIRKDMMQVQIPGTGIKSWIPTNVLVSYE